MTDTLVLLAQANILAQVRRVQAEKRADNAASVGRKGISPHFSLTAEHAESAEKREIVRPRR